MRPPLYQYTLHTVFIQSCQNVINTCRHYVNKAAIYLTVRRCHHVSLGGMTIPLSSCQRRVITQISALTNKNGLMLSPPLRTNHLTIHITNMPAHIPVSRFSTFESDKRTLLGMESHKPMVQYLTLFF